MEMVGGACHLSGIEEQLYATATVCFEQIIFGDRQPAQFVQSVRTMLNS